MSDIRTHDVQGRPYIKLADIKAGTKLRFDGDFGCLDPDFTYVARMNGDEPFVNCHDGEHTLSPQAEDNGGYCLGVYAAPEA